MPINAEEAERELANVVLHYRGHLHHAVEALTDRLLRGKDAIPVSSSRRHFGGLLRGRASAASLSRLWPVREKAFAPRPGEDADFQFKVARIEASHRSAMGTPMWP